MRDAETVSPVCDYALHCPDYLDCYILAEVFERDLRSNGGTIIPNLAGRFIKLQKMYYGPFKPNRIIFCKQFRAIFSGY
ncbi:MAG: hypothetical protein ACJ71D_01570 [Nitrososphaera sp.]